MALVIETGEGLANADSYVSVDEFIAYASARGETVEPDTAEGLLFDAMAYLEKFSSETNPAYKGYKATAAQALQWPRTDVVIDRFPFPKNQIPAQLKRAQMQLGIEAMTFDLMPSSDGFAVAKEKVDVIEVEYATGGRLSGSTTPGDAVPVFPRVDALLANLFISKGMKIRTVRI